MVNKPKFRYSTIEVTFEGGKLAAYITKWSHKPKYLKCDTGYEYFGSARRDVARDDVISESHPRIEQQIEYYTRKLYGDYSRKNLIKFENEVLSKFISNKTSIENLEQDFYKFLEDELGTLGNEYNTTLGKVIDGHPIISKTWSGIGVVSHLFTGICPISAHDELLMQYPGVQFRKTRTELKKEIKSGEIRLATTGELLDKVDEEAINELLAEAKGSKVNLRELNREDALSLYKHLLTSSNVKLVRFIQLLIKTL